MYFEQKFFRPIKRDSSDPVATEGVSKLVSEPGAVAMGSNNSRET